MVDEAHREIYRKRLDAMPAEMREYLQWRKEQRMAFAAKDARIAELEEALRYYAKQSCEGWCDEGGPVYGEDCYGCRARAVLEKGTRT